MTEPLMPKICRNGGEAVCGGGGWRRVEWVEITNAITAEKDCLGVAILDRETTIVKFNCNGIVTSKSTN